MKKTLIIRHNYERTFLNYSLHNIEVIKPDEIFVITDQPFSKTFMKMLTICKHTASDVFIALDADLYIENVNALNDNIHREYCDSLVIDKFRGPSPAGLHIYSKKLMEKMIQHQHDKDIDLERVKRPESDFVWKILKLYNISFYRSDVIIGHHDFHQFREDIFYKYVIRGWRTMASECKEWFKDWEKKDDEDYIVARRAIEWCWENKIQNYPNGIIKQDLKKIFRSYKFQEKMRINYD